MNDISFTTFLKISLMATTQGKFGTLHRMLNSSTGYDFYKKMKLAARGVGRGDIPRDDVLANLGMIKRPSERDHNILMATRFCEWWDSLVGATALEERPRGIYKKHGMIFGIRLVPELTYEHNGNRHVAYLWAIGAPKLTRQAAGAGLYLLREELGVGPFKNYRFEIRDLRSGKTYGEECVENQSASILAADIALMNAMWKDSLPKAA